MRNFALLLLIIQVFGDVRVVDPHPDVFLGVSEEFIDTFSFSTFSSSNGDSIELEVERIPNWISSENEDVVDVGGLYTRMSESSSFDLFVEGDFAYLVQKKCPLIIIDVSNSTNPVIVGGLSIPYGLFAITVVDDYAYVTSETLLHVIDVSTKTKPFFLSSLGLGYSNNFGIFSNGNYLYLSNSYGLSIVDIGERESPKLVSRSAIGTSHGVFVEGDYSYVSSDSSEVWIFDTTSKTDPVFLSKCDVFGTPRNSFVLGDFLYVASVKRGRDDGGLFLFDVSNKTHPEYVQSLESVSSFVDVFVAMSSQSGKDEIAFCTSEEQGLFIVNVTDKNSQPVVIREIDTIKSLVSVIVEGEFGYVSSTDEGGNTIRMGIFDLSNLESPLLVSTVEGVGGYARQVVVSEEKYAYVVLDYSDDDRSKLAVVDVSDHSCVLVGYHPWLFQRRILSMFVKGSLLFVGDGKILKILDFTDKARPTLIGAFDEFNCSRKCLVSDILVSSDGNYSFVVTIDEDSTTSPVVMRGDLVYLDTSDVQNPTFISEYEYVLKLFRSRVRIQDEFVILGNGDVLIYFKKSTFPLVSEEVEFIGGSIFDFYVQDEIVYMVGMSYGFAVVNMSDFANPLIENELDTEIFIGSFIDVSGDYAFVIDDESVVKIVDIQDPKDVKLFGTFSSTDTISPYISSPTLSVSGNFLVVPFGDSGLRIGEFGNVKFSGISPSSTRFCEKVEVEVSGRDSPEAMESSVSDTFTIFFTGTDLEVECDGRGSCNNNDVGVCSGNGHCVGPDTCQCIKPYIGSECETNSYYIYVMTPILSATSFLVLMVGILCGCFLVHVCFVFCCVFICTVCGFTCGLLVMFCGQFSRIRRYEKLRDFDVLLHEQLIGENDSIAHLKINKSLFEISHSEIKTVQMIGRGGSSAIVFLATWKGNTCAFKCFRTRDLCSSQQRFDEFEREVNLLANLHHPNIIRFFGASLHPPRVGILMEFCENGELIHFLEEYREKHQTSYPLQKKTRLALEIISAVEYIHSRNIIHRDLKPENILLDSSETIKLMDFGISKLVENVECSHTRGIGTSIYMSPEIVFGEYDEKCDSFSFAILLWVMFTEIETPYGETEMFKIEHRVANNPNFRPSLETLRDSLERDIRDEEDISMTDACDDWLIDVVERCWNENPERRYSFSELSKIFSDRRKMKAEIDVEIQKRSKEMDVSSETIDHRDKESMVELLKNERIRE